MTVRSRSISGAHVNTVFNGNKVHEATVGGGSESIEGFSHNLSLLGQRDCGGPCILNKNFTQYGTAIATGNTSYKGTIGYLRTQYGFSIGTNQTESTTKSNGTTAIARTTPTSPVFSASVAIGEVAREGLPSVAGVQTWRDRTKLHRGASSEFLNYQFGWLPLVSEVKNLAYAVKNQQKILRDFRQSSGKNIRVAYEFPSSTRSEARAQVMGASSSNGVGLGAGIGYVSSIEETRAWFKGCFTYALPVGDSQLAKAARFEAYANKLLGVRLTPEVLWNLAPWTWAVDWFSNTGDIISNFSNLGRDGLVLKYGYSMYRRSFTSEQYVSYPGFSGPLTSKRVNLHFHRYPSSPYFGFGTTGSLTKTQSAVLVALGINFVS